MKHYYVYLLASERNGTLYIGVTNNLVRRISEHRKGDPDSFTGMYSVFSLVYYEVYPTPLDAINHEKKMKTYNRKMKIALFEKKDPLWNDLSLEWKNRPIVSNSPPLVVIPNE